MANLLEELENQQPVNLLSELEQPDVQEESPGFFKRLGAAVTGSEQMTEEIAATPEVGAAPELNALSVPAFKASLGLLATGDTQSLKGVLKEQFGEQVGFREDAKGNTIVDFPSGSYALNKPGLSAQDIVRGAFDIASFIPAGRAATIPAAVGRSAATEAAIEAAETGVGGEFDIEDVAAAATIGGIFKGSEDLIGAGYRAVKGAPASDLVEAGAKANIPILTSDVRQPGTFAGRMAQQTAEKIPVAGTGPLRERQQELREIAVADVAERYGQFSYSAIVDSLKTQRDRIKSAAGSVLDLSGQKLDKVGDIPLPGTSNAINKARAELSKPGVIKSPEALKDVQTLTETLLEAPQTFTSLKENRTAFRDVIKGADKAERSQLSSRAKSLLGEIQKGMTKDMSDFARQHLSKKEFVKWQKANSVYASEAEKLTKTRLKNVLDSGDVTPESVQTLLFSKKPSEVRSLYQSLTQDGKRNARSAIISKVITNLNQRAAGVTPNSFATEMKKQGLQVNTFFKGEERRQLNGLLKALEATRRAQEAPIATATGQQLLGAGTLAAAATDLGATITTGGTVGGLARLYESPSVRNALLRLDSLPKGSSQFEEALRELTEILTVSAQTAREEVSEQR